MSSSGGRLLERERELEDVVAALDRASGGGGAVLAVAGPAGIGKTRLARAVRQEADGRGFMVLSGRCTELERENSFGLVRQLFEPAVRRKGEPERSRLLDGAAALAVPVVFPEAPAGPEPDPAFGLLYGLFWLCANMAADQPLLLVVDDAHWADEASVRFLDFLAQRVEELPVLVLVTLRSPDANDRTIGEGPATEHLTLRPLSSVGVAALLRASAGSSVDEAFVTACRQATGGNPFLLTELVRGLVARQVPFTDAGVGAVESFGSEAVSAAVQRRVAMLGAPALSLARASSVLGEDALLVVAAELAQLGEGEAAEAAAALARAGVLEDARPLRFEHPIIRSAVEAAMPAGDRMRLHRRAADLLASRSESEDGVALHLLHTEPRNDPWVVTRLADAASRAVARGAQDVAVSMLLRALAEPPKASLRPALLLDLGRAESTLGRPEAADHLLEAHRLAVDPLERAASALAVAWSAMRMPSDDVAIDRLLDDAIDTASPLDPELTLQLEAVRGSIRRLDPALNPRLASDLERFADLPGRTPAECALLADLAHDRMNSGRSAADASEPAERALANQRVLDAGLDSPWLLPAILVLRTADRIEMVISVLDRLLSVARARGSIQAFALVAALRSSVLLRTGDVREAEADARAALESSPPGAWSRLPALGVLVEVLTETNALDEATELLAAHGADGALPQIRPATVLLIARAALALEQKKPDVALADYEEARARLAPYTGNESPVGIDGRVGAALARRALDDETGARAEADTALEIARNWGTPGTLGIALRIRALAAPDDAQTELLGNAVTALEGSPRQLEHARALVDLGAALRRGAQRNAAREPLRRALKLARECGGVAVGARAEVELTATGGRVQRHTETGLDALTPSERRIVERAAAGASNRQIAQELFVTVKTIEMHLGHAYRKLGISSRNELASHLQQRRPPQD